MKFLSNFIIFVQLAVCAQTSDPTNQTVLPNLSNLPHFYFDQIANYRATPYVNAAHQLQVLGRKKAEKQLHEFATAKWGGDQVYILCRMLYSKSKSKDFREPGIGNKKYLGGTTEKDWALNPIEIINGVPFIIISDYEAVYGSIEHPDEYLQFCQTNCDWNEFHFTLKSKQELDDALKKLLKSPKWKRPLNENEIKWLSIQIE